MHWMSALANDGLLDFGRTISTEPDQCSGSDPSVLDNDLLRAAIVADSRLTTSELAERFDCCHKTMIKIFYLLNKMNSLNIEKYIIFYTIQYIP